MYSVSWTCKAFEIPPGKGLVCCIPRRLATAVRLDWYVGIARRYRIVHGSYDEPEKAFKVILL